jgi:membrane-associated phospholipid phosphatase
MRADTARVTRRLGVWIVILLGVSVAIGFAVSAGIGDGAERAILGTIAFRDGRTSGALIGFARALSWFGDTERRTLFVVACAGWFVWKKRRWAALVMAVTPLLASVMSSIMKEAFARARPDVVPHLDTVTNMSYPSGHASNAAATFILLALLLPGPYRMAAAVIGAALIGWSRWALGVHWPSDVVGGWIFGTAFALIGAHIVERKEGEGRLAR